jgi:predicted RND superfamily exporter protein
VLYAIVGLAGIVVNDSLVLIDFVNKERDRGTDAREAVRIASRKRFRPILLTTLTTVAGLLPMGLGLTGYSIVFGPFASSIVFGLAMASVLTLFLVPTLYLTIDDIQGGVRGVLDRTFGRTPADLPAAVGGLPVAQSGHTRGISTTAMTPQTMSSGSPALTKSPNR